MEREDIFRVSFAVWEVITYFILHLKSTDVEKKNVFQKDKSIKIRDYLARILDTVASIQYQTKSYKTLQAMSRIPEASS